jgi:hypothetical protein
MEIFVERDHGPLLDAEEAEQRYRLEPVEFLTAEKIFVGI